MAKILLNKSEYYDKVLAAWIGKNIGGTMGGPYEGTHDILDIQGFITPPGRPLPNDDLDIQLVWLHAMERLGANGVHSESLCEMWQSYVVAPWNEYGVAKINMNRGLLPPVCGEYRNNWKDSNGAWIRTEIWATLFPGCPHIAASYATEDSKVDHGYGEGTVSAAFVAAMQSAAFIINDHRECIELALHAIPDGSRTSLSVRRAIECFDKGVPFTDARNEIQMMNKDMADGWFEAPSNVAYAILGMLYGEGDFRRSMIMAINCGDDTDCTAATVGATLGIMGGTAVIPKDLREHIGDEIITIALNRCNIGAGMPRSCAQLSERIMRLVPHTLHARGAEVEITDGETVICDNVYEYVKAACRSAVTLTDVRPYTTRYRSPLFDAAVELTGGPEIEPLAQKRIDVTFINNMGIYDAMNYALTFRWWLPEGFTVSGKGGMILRNVVYSRYDKEARMAHFTINAPERLSAENRIVLEVSAVGRTTPLYIPITLLG